MNQGLIKKGYKFIYLDTNAVSDLAKNYKNFGKNLLDFMISGKYAPVISVYNLYELSNASPDLQKNIFHKFDSIPVLICYGFPQITTVELNNDDIVLFATGPKDMFNLKFSDVIKIINKDLAETVNKMNANLAEELRLWLENVNNSRPPFELLRESYAIYDKYDVDISELYKAYSSKTFCYIKHNFLTQKPSAVSLGSILDTYNACIAPFVDKYVGERTVTAWLEMSKDKFIFMRDKEFIKVSNFYD